MKATVWTLVLVLGSCVAAEAQPQASAFGDLWRHVKSGDTVFVMDGSGRETTGVFAKVSDSNLSLLVDGQLQDLPVTDVRQIARRGDSVWNGFLIGAAIGAVIGVPGLPVAMTPSMSVHIPQRRLPLSDLCSAAAVR